MPHRDARLVELVGEPVPGDLGRHGAHVHQVAEPAARLGRQRVGDLNGLYALWPPQKMDSSLGPFCDALL